MITVLVTYVGLKFLSFDRSRMAKFHSGSFPTGTNRYFRKVVSRMGIQTSFVDMTDVNNVKNAIKPSTKVLEIFMRGFIEHGLAESVYLMWDNSSIPSLSLSFHELSVIYLFSHPDGVG